MSLLSVKSGKPPHYDAFISYSHDSDMLLAKALHDNLQRFATSWNPLSWTNPTRSLRVFRDEATLSADPALWASIERSLEKSDWLVLLASKSGSKSPWVEKEIEYWSTNKPINHLLLVLTDGELVWDNLAGDFDWLKSTAISRRLAGQFAEEPLWLDLRWARKQSPPTLRNPLFQDAVASLAAPLRGVPKDELIGMDIRQHQQLQRWRNIAFVSLMILLFSAMAAAELARRQRNIALEREAEAVSERARAERQATISQARQLAAQSVKTRLQSFGRMDLSILLAVESTNRENALEGRQALVQSLALTPQLAYSDRHSTGAFQHEPVWAIAYSYDGQLVASAGNDGSVVLRRDSGDVLWQHRMSHDPLQAVAFHPDGNSLATASHNGTAALWRADNGELIEQFNHDGPVVDLAFDNSGGLLATASMDGTARVWEVDSAIEIGRLSFGNGNNNDLAGVKRVAFSAAGDHVAAITKGGQVCLWNIDSRSQSRCLFTGGFGTTLAFSPDGRILGTASENFVSIWNVDNAELLYRFEHPDLLNDADMEHFLWIQDIAFHPGGRFIVSAGRDRTVRLWDLINGQEALRIVEAGPVSALDFSPDGQLLVTTTDVGTIRVWEMLSGRELSRSGLETSDPVTTVSFSPDGTQVAAANMASAVGVWSLDSAIESVRLPHADDVEQITFSPNGRFLATTSDDNIIRVWEKQQSWRQIRDISRFNPKQLQFSEDSQHLMIRSQEAGLERLALNETSAPIQLLASKAVDPILTDRYFIMEQDGTFNAWLSSTGEPVANGLGRVMQSDRGEQLDKVALNGDKDLLAIAYTSHLNQENEASTLEFWNIMKGNKIADISRLSRIQVLALSPSGDQVAVGIRKRSLDASADDIIEYGIEVRKIVDGGLVAQWSLGKVQPLWIKFPPDGKRLIVGTGTEFTLDDIRVLSTSKPGSTIKLAETTEARSIDISHDGQYLAAISQERARIWQLNNGRIVADLPTTGHLNAIRFSPDDKYLVSASSNDHATFWLWQLNDLIQQACGRVTRNLTTREWQNFLPEVNYHRTCPNLPADSNNTEQQ